MIKDIYQFFGSNVYTYKERVYFNVIPTNKSIIVLSISVVLLVLINFNPESKEAGVKKVVVRVYQKLLKKSKAWSNVVYTLHKKGHTCLYWLCIFGIFVLLVDLKKTFHTIILSIIFILVVYFYLNSKGELNYLLFFSGYAAFAFFITWFYELLRFELIQDLLGETIVGYLMALSYFLGYTVMNANEQLYELLSYSTILVLSAIANHSILSYMLDWHTDHTELLEFCKTQIRNHESRCYNFDINQKFSEIV